MIRVSCPKCKTLLQVEDNHAGQVIACSNCKTSLRLPPAPPAPPIPAPPASTPSTPIATATAAAPVAKDESPIPQGAAESSFKDQASTMIAKLKAAWQGAKTPIKAAILGGTSFLFLSCFLCCGCFGYNTFRSSPDRVAQNKKGNKNPDDAKQAQNRSKRKTSVGSSGNNDAELLDFDERVKILVSRIRLKMTKKQVETLIGTPDDENEQDLGELNPAKAGQTLETCTWRDELDSKKVIVIGFVNGSLIDAETNGTGQFGWNIEKGYRTKPLGR
jgi:hypothetical protein